MTEKRRISDFPENFHIEETIIIWKIDEIEQEFNDYDLDFTRKKEGEINFSESKKDEIEQKLRIWENQAKEIIENKDDKNYTKLEIDEISSEIVEKWDILIINFLKTNKNKDIYISLKCLVKYSYSTRLYWYIIISDNETQFTSRAREEKLSIPIIQWYKRKIQLESSLKDALFISLNEYIHESRIKEIILYKKNGNHKWITWIKLISNIIKSKMWNLIWKQ